MAKLLDEVLAEAGSDAVNVGQLNAALATFDPSGLQSQLDGLQFMDIDMAMAANRVILTTEREHGVALELLLLGDRLGHRRLEGVQSPDQGVDVIELAAEQGPVESIEALVANPWSPE